MKRDGENRPLSGWAQGSLQRRFALISGLLLLITSVVFLVLVGNAYRNRILASHEHASMSVNLLLQAALENAMIKRDLDGLQDIVARLGAQDGIGGVMIANPEGEVRFSSYPGRLYQPLSDPALAAALTSREQQTGFRTLADGSEVLRSVNPVHNKPECKECHGAAAQNPINGLLVVDYDSSAARRDTRNGVILLSVLGIVVLLTLEGGLWIALKRIVIARVNRLGRATRRIAGGDLAERVDDRGSDEIAGLGADFNDMADRLEETLGALKASEAFLQALIDAVPDGVRVIDPEFRILMANTTYCAQVGARREEVIGTHCYASSHRRSAPCVATLVECPVVRCIRGGETQLKCSHTHIAEGGGKMPVEVIAAPATIKIDGAAVPCVVESIRDLEAQLNISQEQRLSEMGMLAAGVAHEVHNPLSSIALALRAIGAEPEQTERARKYIRIAETEIANCQSITDALLRLAAPSQRPPELVAMRRIIADTISLLSFEADQRGVAVEMEVRGGPRVLAGDSDMRILIFNLLHNAIHAMPHGGTARVLCWAEDGRTVLQVVDSGIGISPRDRENVLMPFWTKRADGTQGRGLGLSIVKNTVDRLGGTIGLESRLDEGTTFTVDLPSADEAT